MKNEMTLIIKSLKKAKWFVFSTVILMATVITLSSLVISINKKLYFDELPYEQPEEIHLLYSTIDSGMGRVTGNAKGFVNKWYEFLSTDVSYAVEKVVGAKVHFADYQTKIRVAHISPQYVEIFNLKVNKGRLFEDFNINSPASEVLVRESFIEKHKINIEKEPFISINGNAYQIIGVVSSGFVEPSQLSGDVVDIWQPMEIDRNSRNDYTRFDSDLNFYVKSSNFEGVLNQIRARTFDFLKASNKIELVENKDLQINGIDLEGKVLEKSQGVSLLVLICVFILSLMILSIIINNLVSRYLSRVGIYTVHSILGAKLKDILRWISLEILMLIFFAVAISIIMSHYFITTLKVLLKDEISRILELSMDLGFAVILLVIVFFIMTIIMYIVKKEVVNKDLVNSIKSGTKGKINRKASFRGIILAVQITVSIICLSVSIYVYTLTQQEIKAASTYSPGDLHYMQIELPGDSTMSEQKKVIASTIKSELINNNIYSKVELIDNLPLGRGVGLYDVYDVNSELLTSTQVNGIESDFFKSLDIEIIKGRIFRSSEVIDNAKVAIVNKHFSDAIFGGDALGKRIVFENEVYEVVGLVNNITNPFVNVSGSEYQVYIPYMHYDYIPVMSFLMDPNQASMGITKNAIKKVSPDLNLSEWFPLSSQHEDLFTAHSLRIWIAVFSIIITIIFMIEGLRNIISFLITSSIDNLSVRIVSGAKQKDIQKYVFTTFMPFVSIGMLMSAVILLLLNQYEYFGRDSSMIMLIYLICSIIVVGAVFYILTKLHVKRFLNNKTLLLR